MTRVLPEPAAGAVSATVAGLAALVIGAGACAPAVAAALRASGARVGLAPGAAADDVAQFAHDASAEHGVDALFDEVLARFGRPDVLVLTVRAPATPPLHDCSLAQWQGRIAPLRAWFWLLRRALEELLADGAPARIVLVCEGADDVLGDALRSLVRCVAREYGSRGIACNGIVLETSAQAPIADAVRHILFLASPAAAFVTGEVLVTHARAVGPS